MSVLYKHFTLKKKKSLQDGDIAGLDIINFLLKGVAKLKTGIVVVNMWRKFFYRQGTLVKIN